MIGFSQLGGMAVLCSIILFVCPTFAFDELLMGSFVVASRDISVTTAISSSTFASSLVPELTSWLGEDVTNVAVYVDGNRTSLAVSYQVLCPSGSVESTRLLIATGNAAGTTAVLNAHAAALNAGASVNKDTLVVMWDQCSATAAGRSGGIPATQGIGSGEISGTCATQVQYQISASTSLAGRSQDLCNAMFAGENIVGKSAAIAQCTAETAMTQTYTTGYAATLVTFTTARTSLYTALLMQAARSGGLSAMAVIEVSGMFTGGTDTASGVGVVYSSITQFEGTTRVTTCGDQMQWLAFLILLAPLYIVIARAVYGKGKEHGETRHKKDEEQRHQHLLMIAEMQREAAGGTVVMQTTAPGTHPQQAVSVPTLNLGVNRQATIDDNDAVGGGAAYSQHPQHYAGAYNYSHGTQAGTHQQY